MTKEENDYRLFLIKLLPNLKVLDDRAIRDSEREMASAFLSSPGNKVPTSNPGASSFENGVANLERDTILARVKSVSNIAKRSAGKPIKIYNDKLKSYFNESSIIKRNERDK